MNSWENKWINDKESPRIITHWDNGEGVLHSGKLVVMAENIYCEIHERFTMDIVIIFFEKE